MLLCLYLISTTTRNLSSLSATTSKRTDSIRLDAASNIYKMNTSETCWAEVFQFSLAGNLLAIGSCILSLGMSSILRKHKKSIANINKNYIIYLNEIIFEIFNVMTVLNVSNMPPQQIPFTVFWSKKYQIINKWLDLKIYFEWKLKKLFHIRGEFELPPVYHNLLLRSHINQNPPTVTPSHFLHPQLF